MLRHMAEQHGLFPLDRLSMLGIFLGTDKLGGLIAALTNLENLES